MRVFFFRFFSVAVHVFCVFRQREEVIFPSLFFSFSFSFHTCKQEKGAFSWVKFVLQVQQAERNFGKERGGGSTQGTEMKC